MKLVIYRSVQICHLLFVIGCSGITDTGKAPIKDHPSLIAESVFGVLNALGNETEAFNLPSVAPSDCSSQNRLICGATGNPARMTINWNLCTFSTTNGNSILSGGSSLLFSSDATCADALLGIPTSGNLIKTYPKGTPTFGSKVLRADQTQVLTHSESQATYKSVLVGGGLTVVFGASSRTVQISGLHREYLNADGARIFQQTILTAWPHLNMTGSRAAGTRALSGSLTVYHNSLLTTAEISLNVVRWASPACNFPTSGTLSMSFTDAVVGNAIVTFTGCGTATFLAPNGDLSNITLSLNE